MDILMAVVAGVVMWTGAIAIITACMWVVSELTRYVLLWVEARGMMIEYFWLRKRFLAWHRYHNPSGIAPPVQDWSEAKLRNAIYGLRNYADHIDKFFPNDPNPEAQIEMRAIADELERRAEEFYEARTVKTT